MVREVCFLRGVPIINFKFMYPIRRKNHFLYPAGV